ncbi:Lsr2 family protein [Cryobacterium sp. MDB2-33-2]|uniref:histone-like nucleoid-structuring protein Lsr2 n=1 Tax=Cryobacterium sp. MDB2-33-2 TaxID=1259179 RepID=UPI001F545461|nr:Lsr2 family protein [Cryobacterium sp. MDB2-33-2]
MQKTITILEDDLDGTEASETISFALDGTEYAIDLNTAHAKELRTALTKFTAVARKSGKARTTRNSTPSGVDTKTIRAWAVANNIPVPDRGRLRPDVIASYNAAS